jgi:flagellar biosynthesis/type III secretory pathway protein FliH
MSYLLWQRDGGAGIASDRQVLRAHEVPLLESAAELVQHLGQLVAGRAERLQAEVQDARAQGVLLGLAEGRAQARDELASQLLQLQQDQQAQLERLRAEVAALALEVARRLLGQVSAQERLALLAEQAARDLLPAPTLKLHVHPSQLEALRAWREGAAQASVLAGTELCGDATLPPDGCRLETGLGSADASLPAQLGRLAAAWGLPHPPDLPA